MILSKMVSAMVMVVICSLIPVIWWAITARKKENFFQWIGLYMPKLKMKWWSLIIFLVIYYLYWTFDLTMLMDPESMANAQSSGTLADSEYAGMGFAAILPMLIQTFIANGLSEEILFRGFMCKRFQNKFGKKLGFVLQACCFGLMHNLLYLAAGMDVSLQFHLAIFAYTGGGALLLGFLNEKMCNGSIIPSVLLHGLGNFLGMIGDAF